MAVSSGSVSVTLETSEWNKFIAMLLVLTGVQGGGPGAGWGACVQHSVAVVAVTCHSSYSLD